MSEHEWLRGNYSISTDRERVDLDAVHEYLSGSAYWALNRSFAKVKTSIENSLCFGLYDGECQVGLVRVVTDYATFAWLSDVYVLPSHKGQGLGRWLIECVFEHPQLSSMRMCILATRNAHELYQRYGGFEGLAEPERFMIRIAK